MNITIHWTFLPHEDPDASLAFYRDTLGFEDSAFQVVFGMIFTVIIALEFERSLLVIGRVVRAAVLFQR